MKPLLRALLGALVKLYYPVITVDGAARVPSDGAVVFVLNHPNGLIDPLILWLGLQQPVRFLGKSTLFKNPISRMAMEAFGGIPVYRHQDESSGGGDTSRNEETFALCRQSLARGERLALFPEGTTHSDPELKPLKTGAARIALSAEKAYDDETSETLDIAIVPVGLQYEDKTIFRSRVLVVIGEPLRVRDFYPQYLRDERAAVLALTDAEREGLDQVVLQADTRALLEGIAAVATHTVPDGVARDDLAERNRRARELVAGYRTLRATDPARADALLEKTQKYIRALANLGVRDPWALELAPPPTALLVGRFAMLAVLFPLALVGAALAWVPYRLAAPFAQRFTRGAEDILGTVKLLAGMTFIASAWAIEAAVVGWTFGLRGLAVFAVLAPVSGYASLRFGERWDVLAEARRHFAVRERHADVVRAMTERRRALADEIAEALRAMG